MEQAAPATPTARKPRRKDRPGTRPPGRPTALTDARQRKLCKALAEGNTVEVACSYAAVSPAAFYGWVRRGEAEMDRLEQPVLDGEGTPTEEWPEPDAKEARFVTFVEAISRAKDEAERAHVTALHRAATGYKVVKRKRQRNERGRLVTIVEEESHEFDWRAALAWLERRRRSRWGVRQAVEHSGPQGGPIETTARVVLYLPRNGREAPTDADAPEAGAA